MKLISWNVNGIRACTKKGFADYLKRESPDILGIQESKAHHQELDDTILNPPGYHSAWFSAEKKGYSGVALFMKEKPLNIIEGFGVEKFDREGRVITAEYDDFYVSSVYFPNGQMNEERLNYKLEFYREYFDYCNDLKKIKPLIIMGDYNTAHKEIDLARPKENEKTSGFLPIEREWLDQIVNDGYIDTFRELNPNPDEYSWWSYRTRARDRNIGWRIDYCFITKELKPRLKNAFIRQDIHGSDHCPVGIEIA